MHEIIINLPWEIIAGVAAVLTLILTIIGLRRNRKNAERQAAEQRRTQEILVRGVCGNLDYHSQQVLLGDEPASHHYSKKEIDEINSGKRRLW